MTFPADRRRYRLDPKPLGVGGYAEVFRAEEKDTGRIVAFKRSRDLLGDGPIRLRREVKAMVALSAHPNVMDVLDADKRHHWYVMPLADGDLYELNVSLPADALVDALSQVAEGLRAAHELALVHRDVTPKNILYFSGYARWVVADWGLVRGPQGRTTDKVTRTGVVLGTDGFVAPEVLRDAHRAATAAADVYSLGRVAAWAVTGTWPLAGETLLPDGPWRSLVRHATRTDPVARPTLAEFVSDMQEVTYLPTGHAADRAAELARGAQISDTAAAQLLDHADAHRDDPAIFFDHLARVNGLALSRLADDPPQAARLVDAMREHLCANDERWGQRSFDAANRPLTWLRTVALAGASQGQLGVLEDATEALFAAGAIWRRFPERRATRSWLVGLDGDCAQTVARALRRHKEARDWLREEGWRPPAGTHPAIRDALGF